MSDTLLLTDSSPYPPTDALGICNLALSHLGITEPLTEFGEGSPQSAQAELHYGQVRDALLAKHPWRFATKFVKPEPMTTETHPRWSVIYDYPDDCIRVLAVTVDDQAGPGQEFGIFLSQTGSRRLGTTGEAYLKYVARLADVSLYPAPFIDTLAWQLAAVLAPALAHNAALASNAYQMARITLGEAQLANALEAQQTPASRDRYGEARV